MKTPKQWLEEVGSFGHNSACICERCKNGVERFMLEEDVRKIQVDAMEQLQNENARLRKACEKLDSLDWCIGYELTENNHVILDEALTLAREALGFLKPPESAP